MNARDVMSSWRGATDSRVARIIGSAPTSLDALWLLPSRMISRPDPWQKQVLAGRDKDWLICCSRQVGKTETVASVALWEALTCGSFVLVISASERQAKEFMARVKQIYARVPFVKIADEKIAELTLENGGKIMALPTSEATVRGFTRVDLLVIDEASRVPDAFYNAVRPMTLVNKGRKILLTTPFGKRGFFWNEWSSGEGWHRASITWRECPRFTSEQIASERASMGDLWFRQEFECEFLDVAGGIFNVEAFQGLVDENLAGFQW